VAEWSIDRVALCIWSSFYDNVYEHPERPPQHVIENDVALDVWVEEQQRKSQEERQTYSGAHGRRGTVDGSTATQADFEGGKTIEMRNPNPQRFIISEDPELIS
jgi:hypothetical protein